MRKSNWIIAAILLVASLIFLWLWYYLQFNLVDSPRDLVITALWWVIIIGVCIGIHFAEKKRQERVRTLFLAPAIVFNSEKGIVRVDAEESVVEVMIRVLSSLEYSFAMADLSDNSRIRFRQVVRTAKYDRDAGVWQGEVVNVGSPDEPLPFNGPQELAVLIHDSKFSL